MQHRKLSGWCENATALIRFKPDREAVLEELRQHLDDRSDGFLAQGFTQEEAIAKTLDAMGNPFRLAPTLAAVHRPFWGYLLQYSRRLLLLLLVLCLYPCWHYCSRLSFEDPSLRNFDVFAPSSYSENSGRELLHLSQPDISATCDGDRFTITHAAVFTEVSPADGQPHTRLYFRIRQQSLLPMTEHDEYLQYFPVSSHFYAVDSLGNYYPSYYGSDADSSHLIPGGAQTGIFTYTHECWINDFPEDAQWVDICYQREGRALTLRIYLTGGIWS